MLELGRWLELHYLLQCLRHQTADATTEEKEQANQQVDAQLTQGNQNIENAQSIDAFAVSSPLATSLIVVSAVIP
jgi:hypothetical protein